MSIASELQTLNDKILDAYDAVNDKGGTIPSAKNMANLPTAISTISTGSSTTIEALTVTENGTYTAPSGKAYSPVTVNVSSGGGIDLSALYSFTELKSVTLTALSAYTFDYSSVDMSLSNHPRLFIIIPKETFSTSPSSNLGALYFYSIGTNDGYSTLDDNVNMRANILYGGTGNATWSRVGSYSSSTVYATGSSWKQTIFTYVNGQVRYSAPTTTVTGTTKVTLITGKKYACIFGC